MSELLFTGANQREVARFMGIVNFDPHSRFIDIQGPDGPTFAKAGDTIVKLGPGAFDVAVSP